MGDVMNKGRNYDIDYILQYVGTDNEEVVKCYVAEKLKENYYIFKDEKDIFDATFVDRLTDQEIIGKYKTYSKHITQVRKSAIIKFCLKSGLDKFVDVIK